LKINVEYSREDHTYKCRYKGTGISFPVDAIYVSLHYSTPEEVVVNYYNQIHDDRFPLFCELEEYS
jgi:hypothetical protein